METAQQATQLRTLKPSGKHVPVRTGSRPSSTWGVLLGCVLVIAACSDGRELDGSSPAAFTQSVPEVARALPEAERQGFISDLSTIALANGSVGIEEPSLATLVALDGATPVTVKAMALDVRRMQERQRDEHRLRLAEQELEAVSKRLVFSREQLQLAEEAEATLGRVVASEATASSTGPGRTALSFQVKNSNPFAVEIRGVELEVRRVAGLSETLGSFSMLAMGGGCLYGKKIGSASEAPGACTVSLNHEPGARYTLRVAEVHVPGQPLRLELFGNEASQRERIRGLEDELAAKQQVVESLQAKLSVPPSR